MKVENTSVETRGRKPAAERHASSIREAEAMIAGKLPEMAQAVLEMALGTAPEICRFHHRILECPEATCGLPSRGRSANERMLIYAMNRVAGTPTAAGEKQVNMEFVRTLARHVGEIFRAVNPLESEAERAQQFAVGLSQMFINLNGDGA